MNNFNRNTFNNNASTNIVSNYNKLSNDGGRVNVEDVKRTMSRLKQSDVNIVVNPLNEEKKNFTSTNNLNITSQQNQINQNQNQMNNPQMIQNQVTPKINNAQTFNSNSLDQTRISRDRMNSFRNLGK